MKKLILLFSATLVLAGCSSNDNSSQDIEGIIYGKWYQKEMVVNNTVIPYDDHESCGKDYIEFYDTDKIRSIDVWDCEEDLDWMGTFTKAGAILTISNGNESRTVEIIELTTESLAYKYDYDDDGNGINEHYIEKFTKQ